MPEQQLLEESEAAPDDKFEPLILWEAPPDAPEGTPSKVKHASGASAEVLMEGGGAIQDCQVSTSTSA